MSERPLYDGVSNYYDSGTEPVSLTGPNMGMEKNCLNRLKMALAYKPYYNDFDLQTFLDESGLNPDETYNKDTMERRMLETVLAILNDLSNNLDNFMRVDLSYGTKGEAYSGLKKRKDEIKEQIKEIELETNGRKSDFTSMFYTHKK